MGIGVLQLALGEQATSLDQRAQDRAERGAVLALLVIDRQAAEQRHVVIEGAVFSHRHRHFDPVLDRRQLPVIKTVPRCDVDQSRPLLRGHVVAMEHRHFVVEALLSQRVGGDNAGQIHLQVFTGPGFDLGRGGGRFSGFIGDDQAFTDLRQRAFGDGIDAVDAIGNIVVERHGAVAGDGPGGGGPDDGTRPDQLRLRRGFDRKLDPDGHRLVRVVFDLGVGQRGFLHHRPEHRLVALVQLTVE